MKHREVKQLGKGHTAMTDSAGFEPKQSNSTTEFHGGAEGGLDLSPLRPQRMSARPTPAKNRPSGTTAAEQSTLSSIDHIINTQDCICGKDCDLLPSHTWGKQLGEHQRERATPKALALVCALTATGKKPEKQAAASIRGSNYGSCQQRGCGCARCVPAGKLALEGVYPHQVNPVCRPAGFGAGCGQEANWEGEAGTGWLQAQLCQEFPVLSGVSHFLLWASDPHC